MKEIVTQEEIASLYRIYSDFGRSQKEYSRVMGILDELWKDFGCGNEVTLTTEKGKLK